MSLAAAESADVQSLAARFVSAPQLFAPEDARRRLAGWLGDLPEAQQGAVEAICRDLPLARAMLEGIAEASPYLFDLVRGDAERTIALLGCDPERRFADLLSGLRAGLATAEDEAAAMRYLRRMKAEAALLIALCDIGGVWPVMQVTAALTDVAVTATRCSVRWLLAQEAARGRIVPADPEDPEAGCGFIVTTCRN